jgi:predicted nucleic acid-binding protein
VRAAVTDTSPLRYLVLISAIEILPRLFDEVFVPEAVYAELHHARTPTLVSRWARSPPAWLTIVPTLTVGDPDLARLDVGERAAIALAVSMRPDFVLIDDRAGVVAARARGLDVTGTLGLLDRAAQAGLINLGAAIAALKSTNFYARQELFDVLLARDRKRRGEP